MKNIQQKAQWTANTMTITYGNYSYEYCRTISEIHKVNVLAKIFFIRKLSSSKFNLPVGNIFSRRFLSATRQDRNYAIYQIIDLF